jgi:hypothetical protein
MVNCSAFKKVQMNTIDESERAFNHDLDNASLVFMLDNLKRAQEVINQSYKAYVELATDRIRKSQILEGYTVQNDLSNRDWKVGVTPELAQAITGKDVSKKQMLTPAQAEKAGVPKEVVDSLCERRNKGFKLVRMDVDKQVSKLFNL